MRIIILGPTASGKTDLAIQLAERLNTAIISADSRQCYKHLTIGTAKPNSEELQRVPHFNISLLEPDEDDSAIKFLERAAIWEKEIHTRSEHVIFAGGSTLHLTGLIQPFNSVPDANPDNIASLNTRIEEEGLASLYKQLEGIDPHYIKKMDGMNRQRIIRALDVWMQTGKPFSDFHQDKKTTPDSETLVFGLRWDRAKLYERINKRVNHMLEKGLVDEVRSILDAGFSPNLQSLQTVGYREVIDFFDGTYTADQMTEKIKTHTRRYAKRQLTWFRRWDFIHWLSPETQTTREMCGEILVKIRQKS